MKIQNNIEILYLNKTDITTGHISLLLFQNVHSQGTAQRVIRLSVITTYVNVIQDIFQNRITVNPVNQIKLQKLISVKLTLSAPNKRKQDKMCVKTAQQECTQQLTGACVQIVKTQLSFLQVTYSYKGKFSFNLTIYLFMFTL